MKKCDYIFLTVLFIITVALRFLYINDPLWYDEACSWFSAKQSFPMGIMNNLFTLDLQHTPLYFFVLHFWMMLFGDGEIALRTLSLIFSIASVFLIYKICTKLYENRWMTYLTTLVCAVNPLLVFFSVEVRMYPAVMFLVLLSLNYLIDFERKNDKKSLLKLIITNILIPYTYSGGIYYNLALLIGYGLYLYKNKKDSFSLYLKYAKKEWFFLIPYFFIMLYYGIERNSFIVAHEGPLRFTQFVDAIRNIFGTNIVLNIYWPSTEPYTFTFWFTLLVFVPCLYFVYGFFKGLLKSEGFVKSLYFSALGIFLMFTLGSLLKLNIFTVRYIIYLVPILFILSVWGLSKSIKRKHLRVFLIFYIICAMSFSISNSPKMAQLKELAFKSVVTESNNLGLTSDDMVILPFGSDAPYYFREVSTPRVMFSDFHKIVRNPYGIYYDENQISKMKGKEKYGLIYERIMSEGVFSDTFLNYFIQSVNATVLPSRYVLLAFYGDDANAVVSNDVLQNLVQKNNDIKNNIVDVMFKKYIIDIISILNFDFKLVKTYTKDNYTYYLFQKI